MVHFTPEEVVKAYSSIALVYDQIYGHHKPDIEQFVKIADSQNGENGLDLCLGCNSY